MGGVLLWHLLAEVTSPLDAIPGAPAWVGTGLLGGVLGWLLFVHLPAKDKQIAGLLADHDEQMKAKDERHDASTRDLFVKAAEQDRERRADYKDSLATVVAHCEKETAATGAAIRKDLGDLRQLMDEVRAELRRTRGGGGPPQ